MCVPSMKRGLDDVARLRTADAIKATDVPFFKGIGSDKMELLALSCRLRQYWEGDNIIREGEVGKSFFVIAYGSCRVSIKDRNEDGSEKGTESDITILDEGAYFVS